MLSPHLFLCTAKTLCRRHHSFEKMIMKWKPGEADWFVLTQVSLVLITMMNCIPCCLACIPWSLTVSILKEAILHCHSPCSLVPIRNCTNSLSGMGVWDCSNSCVPMLTGTSGTLILFELQSPPWVFIQEQRPKHHWLRSSTWVESL